MGVTKRLSISVCLALIGSIPAVRANDPAEKIPRNLPMESKILIEKLEKFERELMEAAERQIRDKRREVIVALSHQMNNAGRSGKADDVVAIKMKIEELKAKSALPQVADKDKDALPNWVKHEWISLNFNPDTGTRWEFNQDGTGTKTLKGLATPFTWKVQGEDEDSARVDLPHGSYFFQFDRSEAKVVEAETGAHNCFLVRD